MNAILHGNLFAAGRQNRMTSLCSGVPGANGQTQTKCTLRCGSPAKPWVVSKANPFDLDLATIGHFGTGHRLRTLWVGVTKRARNGPSSFYIDRCKFYMKSHLPQDWDGVWTGLRK